MDAVERVRDDEAEHGVPEEFEPLVGGQTAVLVRVRAVGQRTHQKGGLEMIPEPPFQKRVGRGRIHQIHRRCRLVASSRRGAFAGSGVRHGASHQPLRPRGPGACCRCRSSGTRCAAASAPGSARTHQGGDRSLPLRPAVARVAARHLPLRNSHGYFSCFSSTPGFGAAHVVLLAVLHGPGESLQCRPTDVDGVVVCGPGPPPAVLRTRGTVPDSRPGTPAASAVQHHRVTQHGLEVEQVVLEEERVLAPRRRRRSPRAGGPGRRRRGRRTSPGSPPRLPAPAAPDTLRTPPRAVHGRCL